MRRPVRTITLPPMSSRRIRFGEPMSPWPSGVTVAAFSPSPWSGDGGGRLVDDLVPRLAAAPEREVVAREGELEPEDVRLEDAERRLEQLLSGLVALEDDDRAGIHDGPECNRCPSRQLADNSPGIPSMVYNRGVLIIIEGESRKRRPASGR